VRGADRHGRPRFVLTPPVLGREAVPVITDPVEAARRPELAVLPAMAHGESEQGAAIAAAVLPAVRGLDEEKKAAVAAAKGAVRDGGW
jgi:hypothetical protein